jgi:hypothetical protein
MNPLETLKSLTQLREQLVDPYGHTVPGMEAQVQQIDAQIDAIMSQFSQGDGSSPPAIGTPPESVGGEQWGLGLPEAITDPTLDPEYGARAAEAIAAGETPEDVIRWIFNERRKTKSK